LATFRSRETKRRRCQRGLGGGAAEARLHTQPSVFARRGAGLHSARTASPSAAARTIAFGLPAPALADERYGDKAPLRWRLRRPFLCHGRERQRRPMLTIASTIHATRAGRSSPTDRARLEAAPRRSGTGAVPGARFSRVAIVLATEPRGLPSWHCDRPSRAPSAGKAIVPVTGWARLVAVDSDHPAIRGAVIAFVTERSSVAARLAPPTGRRQERATGEGSTSPDACFLGEHQSAWATAPPLRRRQNETRAHSPIRLRAEARPARFGADESSARS